MKESRSKQGLEMNDAKAVRSIRNRLVSRVREATRRYDELLQIGVEAESLTRARVNVEKAKQRYFDLLPRSVFAPCPFDERPLVRTFDPFGLDGPWWEPNAMPRELPTCPHFCVVGGAVKFGQLPPHGGPVDVYPGPEVPFVYPRLLAIHGVTAVASQLWMDHGLLAFAISYFAQRRPPEEQLVAGWRRTTHGWRTQLGESGFRIENDIWDFDLKPWVDRGKLRWCAPGSDNTRLANATEACPYVNLPGERRNNFVNGDVVGWYALPDGTDINPFDP